MKLHGVRFSIHRTFFSLPPLISSLSLPRVFYRLSHTCTNHLTFSHRSTKRDRIVFFRRIKQVGENSFEMVFPFSLFFFFCSMKTVEESRWLGPKNEYPNETVHVLPFVEMFSVFWSCPDGCPKDGKNCYIEMRIIRYSVQRKVEGKRREKDKQKERRGIERRMEKGMRNEEEKDEDKRSWMLRVHGNPSCV